MRNNAYRHLPDFAAEDADEGFFPENMPGSASPERMRRRIVTITRMMRVRIEEFLPAHDAAGRGPFPPDARERGRYPAAA